MRKEPYNIGDFLHVYNRGNRKQPIVLDVRDSWRFLLAFRYFNDEYSSPVIFREIGDLWKSDFHRSGEGLPWPKNWPRHKPLVNILCFSIMNNHYHLVLEEITAGGVTKFMRKIGTGMTNYFNAKYKESGRLFQGAFKSKRIDSDNYLSFLSVYVHLKNPLELYPGGLKKAVSEIDTAIKWVTDDPYNSFADYGSNRNSPIIKKSFLGDMFSSPKEYTAFAKDCMLNINLEDKVGKFAFDE